MNVSEIDIKLIHIDFRDFKYAPKNELDGGHTNKEHRIVNYCSKEDRNLRLSAFVSLAYASVSVLDQHT